MKTTQLLKQTLSLTLLFAVAAEARIQELASYKDFPQNVSSDTWVIFDLDNTTMRQDSIIGTHQWGDHIREEEISQGRDPKVAKQIQLDKFSILQPYLNVVPVENEIRALVPRLQKQAMSVFALTARPMGIAGVTYDQVRSIGVSFDKSFPAQNDPRLLTAHRFHGLLFSGEVPKGELLKKVMDNSPSKPKRIIFVDDREYNLDSIEASFKDSGIDLLSLRYGAADPLVKGFNAEEAAKEWEKFLNRK
jgi:FMN phosphatase YigB (HAD superfamily)